MIKTERLIITEVQENDIEAIMEMENHKDNRDFVWNGTYDQHKAEIENSDFLLFIIKHKEDGSTIGFTLIKLDNKSDVFELRRLVISKKGNGYGKEVMGALFKLAFEELNINRFWLDVYPHNIIGIKLYESLGMHRDGVLRQNFKTERGYVDQIIYSKLKCEY